MIDGGVSFRNAFDIVALYAPWQASYLTGRSTCVQNNGERAPGGLETELRPDDVFYPEYLTKIVQVVKHRGSVMWVMHKLLVVCAQVSVDSYGCMVSGIGEL